MSILFYSASAIAVISAAAAVGSMNAIYAILYLIVSFMSVAVIFYALGAPFIAALEVITYAGAIMVLFMFAIMLLNLGAHAVEREKQWQPPVGWVGPILLALTLLVELVYSLTVAVVVPGAPEIVDSVQVGVSLFGPYLIGVELVSVLLLAGLVGAYYLGKQNLFFSTQRIKAQLPTGDERDSNPA